jgi:hypothetical protein
MILGILLITIPNLLLNLVGVQSTSEFWIRLVGMLLLIHGFFYILAGRTNLKPFFYWTLYTRLGAIVFIVSFIIFELAPPVIKFFWLGDLAGAIWTWIALRSEQEQNTI